MTIYQRCACCDGIMGTFHFGDCSLKPSPEARVAELEAALAEAHKLVDRLEAALREIAYPDTDLDLAVIAQVGVRKARDALAAIPQGEART